MPTYPRLALPTAGLLGVAATLLTAGLALPAAADDGIVSPGLPTDTTTWVAPVPAGAATLAPSPNPGVTPLPGPVGFGEDTTGGAGAPVIHVTSAGDSPSSPAQGTLRWALAQPGAKWIVFDSDMTITFLAPMQVSSNTTIDGRGHHVMLTGHGVGGLQISNVDNVVVEGLEMRDFGDIALTSSNDTDDAMNVSGSTHVWIDHNTLSEAGDKLVGIQMGSNAVTVTWNHFWDQEQNLQIGSMGSANQDVNTTVTVAYNWFDHVAYRLPVVSYAKAHVYNNFMDSWSVSGVRSERLGQVYLESNVFAAGTSKKATTITPAQDCNDGSTSCDSRTGYLFDTGNLFLGKVTTASTGPDHVFDPHQAYSYTVLPASTDLAAQISAGAGWDPSATAPPPLASGTPVVAPVKAKLHGKAHDQRVALELKTGKSARNATVVFFAKDGKKWVKVASSKVDKKGQALVKVKAGGKKATFRALVKATARTTAVRSNAVKVRTH